MTNYDINSDAKWTYQLPPSLDSLVPKRKLSSVIKSTCLWSEVSIIIKNTDKKHQYLLS